MFVFPKEKISSQGFYGTLRMEEETAITKPMFQTAGGGREGMRGSDGGRPAYGAFAVLGEDAGRW